MNTSVVLNNKYHYIQIKKDSFEVTLCDLGASIYSIKYDDDFLTLTPYKTTFENLKYYNGKTVGRSANRHKGNVFVIDGKRYIVENNEKENTLHGGLNGLSKKVFKYSFDEVDDKVVVTFTYISKDGESGFPGNLSLKIVYTIFLNAHEVLCELFATTDKVTVCALTNHSAFTLGEKNIENLKLQINGGKFLDTNPIDLLPIEIKDVPPYLDFRVLKNIAQEINNPSMKQGKLNGYDHFIYFDKINNDIQVLLEGSKYRLKIFTDYAGVQVYSDSWENDYEFFDVIGKSKRGVALEAQDSFIVHTTLAPKEIYKHYIRYNFEKI